MIDRYDLLIVIGLLLTLAGMFLLWGWPGVALVLGVVLVIVGLWGAGQK